MCVKVTACTPWWHLGLSLHKYSLCFNRSSVHTVCGTLARLNICYELYLELDVSMKLWCLLEQSSTQGDSVGLSRFGKADFKGCCIALLMIRVSNRSVVKSTIMKRGYL